MLNSGLALNNRHQLQAHIRLLAPSRLGRSSRPTFCCCLGGLVYYLKTRAQPSNFSHYYTCRDSTITGFDSKKQTLFSTRPVRKMSSPEEAFDSVISENADSKSVESATQSLKTDMEKATDQKDAENKVYGLMSQIANSVSGLSSGAAQDRIISLLGNLKGLGSLGGEKYQTWAGAIWTDLPTLGMAMRENWNCFPGDITSEQWTNQNAFAARLTASEVQDFSLYGIWCLRDILEQKGPSTKLEDSKDKDHVQTENIPIDWSLPAGLVWLDIAGSKMIELVQEQKSFVGDNSNPAWLGQLAKDAGVKQPGYSLERWQFWMKRFKEISEANTDSEIAKLASHGLQKMESLSVALKA